VIVPASSTVARSAVCPPGRSPCRRCMKASVGAFMLAGMVTCCQRVLVAAGAAAGPM
jgi:hypothetical protein